MSGGGGQAGPGGGTGCAPQASPLRTLLHPSTPPHLVVGPLLQEAPRLLVAQRGRVLLQQQPAGGQGLGHAGAGVGVAEGPRGI